MHYGFEGFYFKQQSGENMIALIPAVHMDRTGKKSASLQVVTRDAAYFTELQSESVRIDRRATSVVLDGSGILSPAGIDIDINKPDLSVKGHLQFDKRICPKGDIMGPFQFVPFMECRHSVFSLTHQVNGRITVNGRQLEFNDGIGYIEGDRGRSFPNRYIWTQYSRKVPNACSLMLSAATVRLLGKVFTGVIGFIFFEGKEYRIATYRGAKIQRLENNAITICQGAYTLSAELLETGGQMLSAPMSGRMDRLIRESLACKARYRFRKNNTVLFDFETDQASFEYEW